MFLPIKMEKLCVIVLCVFMNFHKATSRCGNFLGSKEIECATPLNLNAQSVWNFYEADSEDAKFIEYLNCVWLKWGYVDKNGVILYDNLKKGNGLPWQMARMCQDVGQLIEQLNIDFKQAASYCAKNRPKIETPQTVRRCIVSNYRATPVNFGLS